VIVRTDRPDYLARIERLIEAYDAAKRRRLVRRAIKLWRACEADRRLAEHEAQPERVQ